MVLYAFLLLLGISLAGGMESGIIGGKVSKPHSRPYMASIQVENKHHTCGGMLIREDYVLTAAHCLNRSAFSGRGNFEVVLGAHNIHQDEKSQQRIKVLKYIQHPKFQSDNTEKDYSYDIMLLKLKNKAKVNKFVKVMPLPKKNGKTPANVKCSIAGWGLTTPKGVEGSNVMREVTLILQENSKCKESWQHYFNSERMICSVSDGKHAFCQGDSGSPLICNTKPQAIASYTYNGSCVNKTYPQVYVKISHFLPWIKKKIG
ncbi:granzyme B-like [Rhinichthys klamathensis goyatoka]|uniref:granzyme B-like n=1 Tax=Rhinichthys klamathensis goyatoka TaxID=3034132 RepID=UPI0024B5D9CC|nr:granzyme B-like [Rhinichthys klamathensis goyatoka]